MCGGTVKNPNKIDWNYLSTNPFIFTNGRNEALAPRQASPICFFFYFVSLNKKEDE